jgi:hypothetical protein
MRSAQHSRHWIAGRRGACTTLSTTSLPASAMSSQRWLRSPVAADLRRPVVGGLHPRAVHEPPCSRFVSRRRTQRLEGSLHGHCSSPDWATGCVTRSGRHRRGFTPRTSPTHRHAGMIEPSWVDLSAYPFAHNAMDLFVGVLTRPRKCWYTFRRFRAYPTQFLHRSAAHFRLCLAVFFGTPLQVFWR